MGKLGTERRSTNKAIESPTKYDIGWLSGFLEGEGSFRRTSTTEHISIHQVNKEPLDRVLRLFGGKIFGPLAPRKNTLAGKPQYVWVVTGARARGIMLTVYTLMSYKRKQQIEKAIKPL